MAGRLAWRGKTYRSRVAGETGTAGAEGATAPETLRQMNRARQELWKEALVALAEGITFSGKPTEGAPTTMRIVRSLEVPDVDFF
jgi:hypothetical protein